MLNTDFLLHNRDEQVLDNYLKLLAFTAQQTSSDHKLMMLKFENAELKNENMVLKSALNMSLEKLFNNKDKHIQTELKAKIQEFIVQKTIGKAENFKKWRLNQVNRYQCHL
jgi:hypothetical protein